jgi:hypothetical protein
VVVKEAEPKTRKAAWADVPQELRAPRLSDKVVGAQRNRTLVLEALHGYRAETTVRVATLVKAETEVLTRVTTIRPGVAVAVVSLLAVAVAATAMRMLLTVEEVVAVAQASRLLAVRVLPELSLEMDR